LRNLMLTFIQFELN